jgi:hypothetical protein
LADAGNGAGAVEMRISPGAIVVTWFLLSILIVGWLNHEHLPICNENLVSCQEAWDDR